MNVKNFNPFERHVEKITLAAAVLGAAYLIWMAWPPILSIQTHEGKELTADEVEPAVTAEVEQLEQAKERTLKLGVIHYSVPAIVPPMESPLKQSLVMPEVPRFGPDNVPPGNFNPINQGPEEPLATPTAPAPIDLGADNYLGRVSLVTPAAGGAGGNPAAPAAGAPARQADVRLNYIHGDIDRAAMLAEMKNPAIPPEQRLPEEMQQAVVCRIEVQRRQLLGSGWTEWAAVQPDSLLPVPAPRPDWTNLTDWSNIPDTEILQALAEIGNTRQITQPDYFPLADGSTVIQALQQKAQDSKTPEGAGGGPGGAGAGGGGGGGPVGAVAIAPAPAPPVMVRPQTRIPMFAPGQERMPLGRPGMAPGPVPGAGSVAGAGPEGGQLGGKLPFWFFDDSVKPGQSYQYRVRVLMFNPTYTSPRPLKDPAMKNSPTIASAWANVPGTISVEGDMYVYVTGAAGTENTQQRIGVAIYKWNAGFWYLHEISTQPGLQIATRMNLGDPKQPNGSEVNTGLTTVDVQGNNVDAVVVLQNADGTLESRNAAIDRNDPNKKFLDGKVAEHLAAIAATQPAATRPAAPAPVRPQPQPGTPTVPPTGPPNPFGSRSPRESR